MFDDTRSEYIATIHSRRISSSFDAIDESPKIVEVDTGRPKSRSRRPNTTSESGDDPFGPSLSSPLPCRVPPRLSIPDWGGVPGYECRCSTAQTTPRFVNAPMTPTKSVSGESIFRQGMGFYPHYMANTQSFKAKLRSHSAPKQRPEVGPKKRLSLNEMMESRNSVSGVRMQRSCSQAQEVVSFKNAVMGKLDRSLEFGREGEREYCMERRW